MGVMLFSDKVAGSEGKWGRYLPSRGLKTAEG